VHFILISFVMEINSTPFLYATFTVLKLIFLFIPVSEKEQEFPSLVTWYQWNRPKFFFFLVLWVLYCTTFLYCYNLWWISMTFKSDPLSRLRGMEKSLRNRYIICTWTTYNKLRNTETLKIWYTYRSTQYL
jgi:hypothetical protein